ncbi:MAG: peptidoglycan-binding protein [Deltaproteobacteria bacterium]|nr:peptidoglycan-binding protein [Deltaproteobacteria bacterium]
MKRILSVAGLAALVGLGGLAPAQAQDAMGGELFPPNAKPGECYARVFVPPVYETDTKEVLLSEASEEVKLVPARYETAEERVLVEEASERWEVVPATYGWKTEEVMTKPASKRLQRVPAVYEKVSEQVVDTPAHTIWKKGRGLSETVDNATGEIMCLVEVPATYKTVTKTVLKAPARVEEVEIPAQYTTVKRRVMENPPSVRKVEIPAEYKTVKVTKLVAPPEASRTPVPARYQTVTSRRKVAGGEMAWRAVLCETNTTPQMVAKIQRALSSAGYDAGPADNVLGAQTASALRAFQLSKGLAHGGVTMETLSALGVL